MIHPFARFSALPAAGESLWDKAASLNRPAVEFAEFLKAGQGKTAGKAAPAASAEAAPPTTAFRSDASPTPTVGTSPAPAAAAPLDPTPASAAPPLQQPRAESAATATDDDSTGTPHFADVPDSAKYPAGPYRQAPPEYGGEWWLVNPFTGNAPWANQTLAVSAASPMSKYAMQNLPADFLKAFGEMPVRDAGETNADFVGRLSRWKQDLEFFQGTGIPEGLDESQVELASNAYEQWGMGRPVFYEGRYGWSARFPDSAIPDFEMDAASAVQAPHLAIARYQVRLLRQGGEPATPHPFVPPQLLSQNV